MKLSHEQGYYAMFYFLDDYYINHKEQDSLASLLGDLSPYTFDGCISADPAAWNDWKKSVAEVTKYDTLTSDEVLKVIMIFLKFYNNSFGFDLINVIEYIESGSISVSEWSLYISKAINNSM